MAFDGATIGASIEVIIYLGLGIHFLFVYFNKKTKTIFSVLPGLNAYSEKNRWLFLLLGILSLIVGIIHTVKYIL